MIDQFPAASTGTSYHSATRGVTKDEMPDTSHRLRGGGVGSRFYVFSGVENDAVEEDEGGEESAHAIEGGHFAVVFDTGGVAIHGHPPAATGRHVLSILAIGGEVPVDQAIKDKPAKTREDALAEAHGNRYSGSHRAHPHKQVEDVLYHKCELAVRVPNNAMRIVASAESRFLFRRTPRFAYL